MNLNFKLTQPHIKAKIFGSILIIIGIYFLLNTSPLYMKLGFTSLLIGIFMIFMITEKSKPQKISNAQIKGNLEAIKNITKELNLSGNAVFIPKSDILTEERVFIPLDNSKLVLPKIDNDFVFSTGSDGKSLGISLPPSGLNLLNEAEKEVKFENSENDEIEEKLQSFVGMDIVNSISFKKKQNIWNLEINKPDFCPKDISLCNKYPCPSCSAIISAITRASGKNMLIQDTDFNGKKTTFHLKME